MGRHFVALDLETTGLNRETDSIIEIGAVRFDDSGDVLDTYNTLINPRRPIPPPIQALTGITDSDLEGQPGIEVAAGDLEDFLGDAVLVGHNVIDFDAIFIDAAGIRHSEVIYDTHELARILLPAQGEYGLSALAASFGIQFPVHHRALGDADASRLLFLALRERARGLSHHVLGRIAQWLTPTSYPFRSFFTIEWQAALRSGASETPRRRPAVKAPATPLDPRRPPVPMPEGQSLQVLASAAERSDLFEAFEERAEQRSMLEAVAAALNDGHSLIVEAGTGTGKSLAYLIPAACYALTNDSRVVVSTSTINLQEQLINNDIPALQSLLTPARKEFRSCQLKGRRNYLCLKRFQALEPSDTAPDAEAHLASRILVWLEETETGDRAEMRLSPDEERLFQRLSADGTECTMSNSPYVADGSCFLQRARRHAESSHIVVVNHSLLLSDAAAGGYVLPPFDHLVIDEAHHLEDESTRQFGFSCSETDLTSLFDRCDALGSTIRSALRTHNASSDAYARLSDSADAVRQAASAARPHLVGFIAKLASFMREHGRAIEQDQRLSIGRSMRVQPSWPDVEIAWENLKLALTNIANKLRAHCNNLSDVAGDVHSLDIAAADAERLHEELAQYVIGLSAAVEDDDPERVTWVESGRNDGSLTVTWVPLSVDNILQNALYAGRRTVILTGATLRSDVGFGYIRNRLGLANVDAIAVGSPFDYQRAALVLVPRDMPEPNHPDYLQHLAGAISELVEASHGRALVLFTSHSMLRGVRRLIQDPLHEKGLTVLAQGVDGSPRQLTRALKSSSGTVILGTSSFWEGVDVPGDALSLLIMARLPFNVPTDPVFAARSALYDDAFSEYALPQAILRFKQGFGRLIRTRTDRGALVVLDQRITSRQYGAAFLRALPDCTVRTAPVRQMPALASEWLRTSLLPSASPSS